MGYNFDAESTSTGWDTVFFTPTGDDNQVKLEIAHTKVPGEKVGGSAMGDLFDIVIFQLTDEFDIKNLDRFEGILSHPETYVQRMIKDDWYGMITKKTSTSNNLTDEVFDKWSNMMYNPT